MITAEAERTALDHIYVAASWADTLASRPFLMREINRALGEGWQVEAILPSEDGVRREVVLARTGEVNPQPQRQVERLAGRTADSLIPEFEARHSRADLTTVEWRPADRTVVAAMVPPTTVEIRDALVRSIPKIANKVDLEIGVEWGLNDAGLGWVQRVVVRRCTSVAGTAAQRRDVWVEAMTANLPLLGDDRWSYVERPINNTTVLTRMSDALGENLAYDVDIEQPISVTEPWLAGRDESGEDVYVDIAKGGHMLIAGATRSGKSVCTYGLLVHLLRMRGAVRILIADPNDTTVAPFESMVSWSTSDTEPGPVTDMLRWVRAEMDRRKPILRAMRTDKLEHFSDEMPLIVIVIDEAANYLRHADAAAAKEFKSELLAVVSQGAKYGVRLVLITQRPDSTILDTSTRAQLATRICFRVEDQPTATMAFPELEDPNVLLGLSAGVGFLREVGDKLRRFRGFYLSDHWGAADKIGYRQPRIDINDLSAARPMPVTPEPPAVRELEDIEMTFDDLDLDDDEAQDPAVEDETLKWAREYEAAQAPYRTAGEEVTIPAPKASTEDDDLAAAAAEFDFGPQD